MNRLKAAFKDIEGEWESTYTKLHAARVSINKKIREAEKAVEIREDAPETTTAPVREADAVVLSRVFGRR